MLFRSRLESGQFDAAPYGVATIDIVFLLVPISLGFAFLIGGVFWYSLRSGQFDDLDGPAHRVLMDDDRGGSG